MTEAESLFAGGPLLRPMSKAQRARIAARDPKWRVASVVRTAWTEEDKRVEERRLAEEISTILERKEALRHAA